MPIALRLFLAAWLLSTIDFIVDLITKPFPQTIWVGVLAIAVILNLFTAYVVYYTYVLKKQGVLSYKRK